jgi:hypothetical protein
MAAKKSKSDLEKRQDRNRARRAKTLLEAAAPRTKATQDEALIKRKVDYVARAMAEGVSVSKARKEVGLSRKSFEEGIRGTQFFSRDMETGERVKKGGKLQLNLKPTSYIDGSGDLVANQPLVGKNAALVRDHQKQVRILLSENSTLNEKNAARRRLKEISKEKIVDVYGKRVDLTGDYRVVEAAYESSDQGELDEFLSNLENTDGRQKR